MLIVQEPRTNGQSEEVHTDSYSGVRIPGFSLVLNVNEDLNPLRETSQNPTGCPENATPGISFGEGNSTVCGKDNCYHESYPTSPNALPSSPDANEFCSSPELRSGGGLRQIQYSTLAGPNQQGGPEMVGGPHNIPKGGNDSPTRPINNSALRCIQSGLGSSAEWPVSHRGYMVSRGSKSPHQLSGVASCLPSNQGIWEDLAEHHGLTVNGQRYSSELCKPERGHSLQGPVPVSNNNMDLVHREEYHPPSRAPYRPFELTSQQGVQNSEGPMRLETEPVSVPLEVDLFASRLHDETASSLLQLETRSRGRGFMQNWVTSRGFADPPWCLIHCCLTKVRKQAARIVLITPLWKTQPWFPLVLELLEDYPRKIPQQPDLVSMPLGQEFLMQQGVPQLIAWPISGNPTHHEEFLHRVQTSCSHHGKTKPNSNYDSSFSKWAGWCQQRGRDPLTGPIEDVVNFLAKLRTF